MSSASTDLDPIFIIGSPRSGTTMLAGLLTRTPWGDPFETHFIVKYYRSLSKFGDLADPKAFRRLAAQILSERAIVQRKLGLTPEGLYESVTRHDYATLVDAIGRAYGRLEGHASWGDKTPHYITDVDVLHALFPRSKMLYIVRDGRDVALSLLAKRWGPATIYTCACRWRDENEPRPIFDLLRSQGLLHDLRYEDLLATPRETLAAVMSFLDQDLPSEMLAELTESIRRTNAGKWERRMSSSDIELFERVASETLSRFGYPVTHAPSPVGTLRAMRYTARDTAKHLRNLFVMNVVDTIRIRYFGKEPFAE
jgi:LPS sulfotransferase NodH